MGKISKVAAALNTVPEINKFWIQAPNFYTVINEQDLKTGKELYDDQIGHLGNAVLIQDYDANVQVNTCKANALSMYQFPVGALISGSFVMHYVERHINNGSKLPYDDIDIYFKSKDDAKQFLTMNNADFFAFSSFDSPMCSYGYINGYKYNLIYGVSYSSPENLISRFDIRACSMTIDPHNDTLYVVKGSVKDLMNRKLTFNPVPRGVSVRRFTKYILKKFTPDRYQNLFFVELLRSDIYSAELELMTKEY